jgi:hypothetical protein
VCLCELSTRMACLVHGANQCSEIRWKPKIQERSNSNFDLNLSLNSVNFNGNPHLWIGGALDMTDA